MEMKKVFEKISFAGRWDNYEKWEIEILKEMFKQIDMEIKQKGNSKLFSKKVLMKKGNKVLKEINYKLYAIFINGVCIENFNCLDLAKWEFKNLKN